MGTFKWDYKEILDNIKKLEELLKVDSTNKELISGFLENYKKMLMLINNKNINKVSFNIYNFDEDKITVNDIIESAKSYYNQELLPLIAPLFECYDIIKSESIKRNLFNYKIRLSNKDLISFTNMFFKSETPNQIFYKYISAFNNNFININYINSLEPIRGFTLFDPFLEKKYVSITRNNTLLDLGVIPHEMFHYIINDYDSGIKSNEICDLLSEVDGCFADILYANYHLNHAIYNKDFFKNHTLYSLDYIVGVIAIRTLLINSLDENNRVNKDVFNKKLKENNVNAEISEDEYLLFFKDTGDYLIRYGIGYLAGLDIFYNYQIDRNKALEALINIRNCRETNDILKLFRDNGITFMDDGYKNLKKYLKN